MSIKKRLTKAVTSEQIENLAIELADKPYGEKNNKLTRTTISLPENILLFIEDMAIKNKRSKKPLKSVSAIVRDCISQVLKV